MKGKSPGFSYDDGTEINPDLIEKPSLICTGRLGTYNYYNVDHCLDMSKFIKDLLSSGKEPKLINRELMESEGSYRIVD